MNNKKLYEALVRVVLTKGNEHMLLKLGEGYSRVAYEIVGTDYVLKIAKTAFGVAQSQVDCEAYYKGIFKDIQAPIFYSDENYEVIIVAKTIPHHRDEGEEWGVREGHIGELMTKECWSEKVVHILSKACANKEFRFVPKDLVKISSWGRYKGKNVIIDAGWAKRTADLADELSKKFNRSNDNETMFTPSDYKKLNLDRYENLKQRYDIYTQ